MTTPAYGTWDYTYDALGGVVPVTDATVYVSPDPAGGSVAGGNWSVPDPQYVIDTAAGPRQSAWIDARADTAVGDITLNSSFAFLACDGTSLVLVSVTPTVVYTTSDLITYDPISTGDFSSGFHEYLATVEAGIQKVYFDGFLIDTRPAPAFAIGIFFLLSAQQTGGSASSTVRGLAFATLTNEPATSGDGTILGARSQMHLGATGLTVDFDDAAHYPNQLNATQVLHHNNVGKGI